MKLADFDYHLPADRIAQTPLQHRDASRLMIVDKRAAVFCHTRFSQIGDFLPPNSLLVLNDTKVIPARLIGKKVETGGKIELLLVREKQQDVWEVLAKPQRSLKIGTRASFRDGILTAEVLEKLPSGLCTVHLRYSGEFFEMLATVGQVPLPPYIKRAPISADVERYQSVYASAEGAIAAPTAGLHFTRTLLTKLKTAGIETVTLTLHVGIGTFQPVTVKDVKAHKMHAEYVHLAPSAAAQIRTAQKAGQKIVAVGTTVVRALETAGSTGAVHAYRGNSDLFIYPGHQFRVVDALITNFHLPKSTLLLLVSAFASCELIQRSYAEALRHNYRFYSYGDAMLIL